MKNKTNHLRQNQVGTANFGSPFPHRLLPLEASWKRGSPPGSFQHFRERRGGKVIRCSSKVVVFHGFLHGFCHVFFRHDCCMLFHGFYMFCFVHCFYMFLHVFKGCFLGPLLKV